MTDSAWMNWAKQKYGTDEEGVRKIMSERGAKGSEIRDAKLKAEGKKHRGGFSDIEFAKEANARSQKVRYNKGSDKTTDSSGNNGLSGNER